MSLLFSGIESDQVDKVTESEIPPDSLLVAYVDLSDPNTAKSASVYDVAMRQQDIRDPLVVGSLSISGAFTEADTSLVAYSGQQLVPSPSDEYNIRRAHRMNIQRDKSCCCSVIQPSSLQEKVVSDYSSVISFDIPLLAVS